MKLNYSLYCVYDKVSKHLSHFGLYPSDGLACRSILSTLQVPLKDTQLYRICEVSQLIEDESDDFLRSYSFGVLRPIPVDWSCYKFPETVAEALNPLNLSGDELKVIINHKKLNKE